MHRWQTQVDNIQLISSTSTVCVLLSRSNSCDTLSCFRRLLHDDNHAQGDALAAERILKLDTSRWKPFASVVNRRGGLAAGVKQ